MTLPRRMKFGVFLAPFHRVGENPTLAMDRDLELVEWLDQLGFDEAWIGEHHSAGWEIIASPEVMIGALARTTRSIRLGTGVSSLPYHHPFILADRIVQLDHMTRGRVLFGVGPGALTSDAYQMGIEAETQRPRMEEAMEAIMALLEGAAPVTVKTDWFELREARLQLRPYSDPCFPIAAASTFSPAGPRICGRFGVGMLSISAFAPGALVRMKEQWQIAEDTAAQYGKTVRRDDWRMVLPFYIAESREQALDDVREGYAEWWGTYFEDTMGRPKLQGASEIEQIVARGGAIVGTPDDAITAIRALDELSGGFGGILGLAHEWAPREKILHSYELWARYVAPQFQGSVAPLKASRDWVAEHMTIAHESNQRGVLKAFADAGIPVPSAAQEMHRGGVLGDTADPAASPVGGHAGQQD
jgi:limonene 1,2-monooxygenase